MPLFPSRVPAKLDNKVVDLPEEPFREQTEGRGLNVLWEQAARCPCAVQTQDVNLEAFGFEPQGFASTRASRADCPVCHGSGILWHSAQPVRMLVHRATEDPKRFGSSRGTYKDGHANFTARPEHLVAHGDRLTVLDSNMVFTEVRTRTTETVEELRYPIVERVLDLEGGKTSFSVLYVHIATENGSVAANGVREIDVDFGVTDGKLDWSLGEAAGRDPLEGALYSVTYFINPRYVVTNYPNSSRDTWLRKKRPAPELQLHSVHVQGKLEFLGGPS